jgi:inosose dehydratase
MMHMSELSRREFLTGVAAIGLGTILPAAPQRMTIGYAAITWGGDDVKAIEEVSSVGYKGIQLRASVLTRFGDRPAALRELLREHNLTFAVLSSGDLVIDSAVEREQLALHRQHAQFVHDAGGQFIQVIDQRPKGREITTDDYTRLGKLLTTLGQQTETIGIPLVYHHHMNSTGEKPQEIEAILEAADRTHVGLLFDIAHYTQAGGDPVPAIRRYRDWIKVVHLKDVKPATNKQGYEFVELGHGRVDVKGCTAALRDIGFTGWAIVELDRAEPGSTPKVCAVANSNYVTKELGLTL